MIQNTIADAIYDSAYMSRKTHGAGYSKLAYRQIADYLFIQGFNVGEVCLILDSKHMRWSYDRDDKANLGAFIQYYGETHNHIRRLIKDHPDEVQRWRDQILSVYQDLVS